MNEKHKIDDLFKKALSDYREDFPSENTEKLIFRELSHNKYLRIFKISLGLITIALPIALFAYLELSRPINSENGLTTTQTGLNTSQHSNTIRFKTKSQFSSSKIQDIKQNSIQTGTAKVAGENTITQNQKQHTTIKYFDKETVPTSEPTDLQLDNSNYHSTSEVSKTKSLYRITAVIEEGFILTPSSFWGNERFKKRMYTNRKLYEITGLKASASPRLVALNCEVPAVYQLERTKFTKLIQRNSRFALEINGNVFYLDQNLNSNEASASLVKSRNAYESNISTITPGIELKYSSKDFFFQTGISYQLLGEKINYNLTDVNATINTKWVYGDSLVFVIDNVFPTLGHWKYDTIWSSYNDTTYYTSQRIVNHLNTYQYFELPFLIGKSFVFNKFSLDVSSGFSIGILLKSDAQILATDNSSFIRIENAHSSYINDVTMNYILRIALRYSLSEKWSVFLRPSLKRNLGSILNDDKYPVQQKYTMYGIGMGLMYNF